MVFDDEGLARKPSEIKGSKSRPGSVDYIRIPDEPPKLHEIWLANDTEWKRTIIVFPRRSLRDQRNFELRRVVRIAEGGEAAGEGQNNRFDATNTGREEMRIKEQLHSWDFWDAGAGELGAADSEGAVIEFRRRRETAMRMASNVAAILRPGDQVWI